MHTPTLAFIILLSCTSCFAQMSVEETATAYFEAVKAKDQQRVGDLLDEAWAEKLGKTLLRTLQVVDPEMLGDHSRLQALLSSPDEDSNSKLTPIAACTAYLCASKSRAKHEIVGVVREAADQSHVLYRDTAIYELPSITRNIPDILTCVYADDRWSVVPPKREIEQLMNQLSALVTKHRKSSADKDD